jgi:hypothetical protein
MKASVTQTVEVEVTVERLAEWFSALDDDAQARFFVEVARVGEKWGPGKMEYQFWLVGSHLRNCACSTEDARELVRTINAGMEQGSH